MSRLTHLNVRALTSKIDAATGLVITAGTNATPIVLTIAAHGYLTGDKVGISAVAGLTAANGVWSITRVDADTFSLTGSVGNSGYTSGGLSSKLTSGLTVADLVLLQDALNRVKSVPADVVDTLLSGLTTL